MRLIRDGETIRCGTDSIYSQHPWESACRPAADTPQHKQFACQLQWAHVRGHGTETALRRIINDLLAMTGGGNDLYSSHKCQPMWNLVWTSTNKNISRTHAKRERERVEGGGEEGAEWEKNGSTHLKPTWTSKFRTSGSGLRWKAIFPAFVNTPLMQNWEFSTIFHGSSPLKLKAEFNRISYCAHLPSNVVQMDVTCWQLSQSFQPYIL